MGSSPSTGIDGVCGAGEKTGGSSWSFNAGESGKGVDAGDIGVFVFSIGDARADVLALVVLDASPMENEALRRSSSVVLGFLLAAPVLLTSAEDERE